MGDLFKKLGGRIKEQREKAGMTQEELSETVGLSQNFLSQLENGRRKPSLGTVSNIASALNVPIHSFFLFSPREKRSQGRSFEKLRGVDPHAKQ